MKREIRNKLAPLTDQGFAIHKDIVFLQPIDKYLRSYLFEKSASSPGNGFYIWRFIQPLYLLVDHYDLSYGQRLSSKRNNQFWTNEDLIANEDLIEVLIANQSKLLRVNSPSVFVDDLLSKDELNIRQQEALAYSAHYVNQELCDKHLRKVIELINEEDDPYDWMVEVARNANEFIRMDHSEREELLAKNRIQTVHNLGLDKYLDQDI